MGENDLKIDTVIAFSKNAWWNFIIISLKINNN